MIKIRKGKAIHVPDDNEMRSGLDVFIDDKNEEIERLKERIRDLESGAAYHELQHELQELGKHCLYRLTDKEQNEIDKMRVMYGYSNLIFNFEPTGIGMCLKVATKDKPTEWTDITDISAW